MATLAEALKDRKGFPDTQEVVIGDGLKITLGELRGYQEASGQDLATQLETERQQLAAKQAELTRGQEEVVKLWTDLQEAKGKQPVVRPTEGTDWTKDPFFAPIAEHLDKNVMSKINEQSNQMSQISKAIGAMVKYATDVISEQRYAMLPEDFRKETPYDKAVKTAADSKYLDAGGVPDVRKVYDAWQSPRQREAEIKKVQEEAYAKARHDLQANSLARPSGMPVGAAPSSDPNAPKNIRESFARLKEDPEFLSQIYNLTGQA